MTSLIYSLVILLAIGPARAELSIRDGAKSNLSRTPASIPQQKKKPKFRIRMNLIDWAKLRKVQVGDEDGTGKDGEDKEGSDSSSLGDLGSKLFGSQKGKKGPIGVGANGTGSAVGFNNDAKKNDPTVDPGPKDGGGDKPKGTPPTAPPKEEGKVLPFWIPICFFFDSKYNNTDYMDAVIKQVVDNFGRCDVVVRPFPFIIKKGTYNPDDPESINQYAQTKCNANQAFKVDGTAAQTHPDSAIASDLMCTKYPKWIKYETRAEQEKVAGCSGVGNKAGGKIESSFENRAGDGYGSFGANGVPQVSIVDRGEKDASTHELGHSVGNPGQGGDYLVNKGEGKPDPRTGKPPPDAGEGLEWMRANGPGSASFSFPKDVFHASNGTGLGTGFTKPAGCDSIKGGANNNDRNYRWDENRSSYFRGVSPGGEINFNDGLPIWGREVPIKDQPPPPPLSDRGRQFQGEAIPRASAARSSPPQASSPSSGPPDAKHPKNSGIAGDVAKPATAQEKANAILANSTTSIPPSIPQLPEPAGLPEPSLKDPTQMAEPVVKPPDLSLLGKGGTSNSVTFDNNAAKGAPAGSILSGASSTGSAVSSSSPSGAGSSISFDESTAKGSNNTVSLPSTSGVNDGAVSLGRTSRPPVIVTEKDGDRTLASLQEKEEKKKKQKKEKRKFGDGLRKGAAQPLGEQLYQSVTPNFSDTDTGD